MFKELIKPNQHEENKMSTKISFLLKEHLEDKLSEITNSTMFNAAYEEAFGIRIIKDDPSVLTISLHADEDSFFATMELSIDDENAELFFSLSNIIVEVIKDKTIFIGDMESKLSSKDVKEIFAIATDIVIPSTLDDKIQEIILYNDEEFSMGFSIFVEME